MPETDGEAMEFVLERVFAAPPTTVWRTWTEPSLLARWYKPNAECQTAVLEHDLRSGGVMRYEMRFGETQFHYEHWEFDLIEPPTRLRWKQSLTDADGNIVGNPRMPDWPRVMLTTIELEPHPQGTLQRLRWLPHEATNAEIECFRNASAYLDQGWVAGFNSLAAFLERFADE
ncbi:MAG: SRPBCC domain-containing protein [Myxococcota bacterium]